MVRDGASTHQPFLTGITARDLYAGGIGCYQIPHSLISVIVGVLQELVYPEPWTGDDADIALSMRQIHHFLASLPISQADCECDGDCECPTGPDDGKTPYPTGYGASAYCLDDCEDCMCARCGLNPADFEIKDGQLFVRDACTGEMVSVGAIRTDEKTEQTVNPAIDVEDPETWSTCGKASAIPDLLQQMIAAAWEVPQSLAYPAIESSIRALAPWATFGRQSLWQFIGGVGNATFYIDESEFTGSDNWDLIKCRIESQMNDDPYATDEEVEAVWNTIYSVYSDIVDVVYRAELKNMFKSARAALGTQDNRQAIVNGASNLTADCTCPELSGGDPTAYWSQIYDWVLSVDFVNDDISAWTLGTSNGTTSQTSEGLTVIDDTTGGENSQAILTGTITGGVIKAVHQEWVLAGNGDDGNLGIQMTPYTNMQAVETYQIGANTARTVYGVNHTIIADLNVAAEGSYDAAFTPAFHVIKRCVWAGTGTPPV